MPEALASIGNFFTSSTGSGLTKLAELGATGAGLASNISAEHAASKEADFLRNQQDTIAKMTPQQLAAQATAATQPLNAGLVQAIQNQVSGNLAEQGLAEAPGIQAAVLSQSLAPYYQQNQQTAMNAVLQKLGLPTQIAGTYLAGMPKPTNLSPLLALLQSGTKPANGSTPGVWTDVWGGTPKTTATPAPSGAWDFLSTLFPSTPSNTTEIPDFSGQFGGG